MASTYENDRIDLLPYDFVRENEVIVVESNDGFIIVTTKKPTKHLYEELQRHLNSSFNLEICEPAYFNEILTSSFSSSDHENDIFEELSDEFDLQNFAGSINATEDLLSGNNDTPIIKLINGIISQAN